MAILDSGREGATTQKGTWIRTDGASVLQQEQLSQDHGQRNRNLPLYKTRKRQLIPQAPAVPCPAPWHRIRNPARYLHPERP